MRFLFALTGSMGFSPCNTIDQGEVEAREAKLKSRSRKTRASIETDLDG